jgi:septal ring factor EnvC (AmiA/AmiB activator)
LTQKKSQEKALAHQLKAAYSSGHHDYIKLMLNQEQPSKVQRTLTYYQYLNKARMESIDEFKQVLIELKQVEQAQAEQAKLLEQLLATQQAQQKALKQEQQQREQTLAQLTKKISTGKQKLNNLEQEEQSLVAALAKLQEELARQRAEQQAQQQGNISFAGLGKLKKKLTWPVSAKIKHSFGTQKEGYLKWKGVLMNAPLGKSVKTIHHGTVLFADWLKGYGLVIVVDHGEGYMSLYGHNQTLLKNVGDIVETGEPIALVGQSGGQVEPALYFEIRHQGQAKNPKLWCR